MGDVLRKLGNRTLTVWGDSVASQHAHGKEGRREGEREGGREGGRKGGRGVLRKLGNRMLTVWGDSVASQHAHGREGGREAGREGEKERRRRKIGSQNVTQPLPPSFPAMECSWLRSGKAETLNYDKQDFNRIFKKKEDGGGFNRAGSYGTNALYTWRTQLLPQAGGREGGMEGKPEEEGGVEGTMKFYLTYRPALNESEAIIEGSDVLVINFGLHYLVDKRAEFQEEMIALLTRLRGFGRTEGKQLIWREVSFFFSFSPSFVCAGG